MNCPEVADYTQHALQVPEIYPRYLLPGITAERRILLREFVAAQQERLDAILPPDLVSTEEMGVRGKYGHSVDTLLYLIVKLFKMNQASLEVFRQMLPAEKNQENSHEQI